MTIARAVRDELLNAATVVALVGSRVYWVRPKSLQSFPFVMVRLASQDRLANPLTGTTQVLHSTVQVRCWSQIDQAQACSVSDAVVAALDGFMGTMGGAVTVKRCSCTDVSDAAILEEGLFSSDIEFQITQ